MDMDKRPFPPRVVSVEKRPPAPAPVPDVAAKRVRPVRAIENDPPVPIGLGESAQAKARVRPAPAIHEDLAALRRRPPTAPMASPSTALPQSPATKPIAPLVENDRDSAGSRIVLGGLLLLTAFIAGLLVGKLM